MAIRLPLLFCMALLLGRCAYGQGDSILNNEASASLFKERDPLPMRLKFSIKDIKRNTNDSTYIATYLSYPKRDSEWDSLRINLRARGNFRRENCYYAPLKIKFTPATIQGTIFENNPKLKLVLPCLIEKNSDDFVLKEYLAYKLYEIISPYHFKTRLVDIELLEERSNRVKKHQILAFLIEDIEKVAERHQGKELTRNVHPLYQDAESSITNALFQYLIGNTDFSTNHEHNEKLLYINEKYICIPYDFDMSGLVNASYATISGLDNLDANITQVTERVYKGYKRDAVLLEKVRQYFITHKGAFLESVEGVKTYFRDPSQFLRAKAFIADFFELIENDKKFKKYIVDQARIK